MQRGSESTWQGDPHTYSGVKGTRMEDMLRYIDIVAKIAIPLTIFFATQRIARAQYVSAAANGWNEYNKAVLSNDDNATLALEFMNPPDFAKGNRILHRKAYLGFLFLNAASMFFVGLQNDLIDKQHNDAQFSDLVGPLLLDDHFFQMSQGRGYHPKFREACRQAREHAQRVTERSAPRAP